MATQNKATVSKIVPKVLGNPKAVTALPDGQNKYFLGTIYGRADGLARRTMPTGESYTGLRGMFEAVPADEREQTCVSGVCYLPAGIFETVAGQLTNGDIDNPADDIAGKSVAFAFEVSTVKDSNKAGYRWEFNAPFEPSEDDPLAALRSKLPARQGAKALTDPGAGAAGASGQESGGKGPKAKAA